MKIEKRSILTEGNKDIQYTHIQNNSQVICFMFSGSGYTYDKPLFYYSTMVMLENNFDVVHIHYSYNQSELNLPKDELANLIVEDVNPVVKEVIGNGDYDETIFLGKSLGTIPIISMFANDSIYSNSKMIILTPLLQHDLYYKRLLESKNKTLLVIGNVDTHYIPEKVTKLAEKTNFNIIEIVNANHSLDIEQLATSKSITALNDLITDLKDFISK
ncbi:alpha/beta hydrolase [Salipaludibacillus neizhouensis]|uniref:Alpha/beta hydrolase n=1 Tax=Salipaludibacillus neizhouensis TaxID=885475 RepID=A0A3A9K371_9BACI|nr:alpha/beta hydrolase [Salipaludibacillus neizhouensis]RKL64701.1 alpha/beta hydrolase [Salipaludibacillus neizhouensis]